MSGVELHHGVATDVGLVREVNEDAYLASPPVFVVADGMGGHDGGDVASAIVVEEFSTLADAGFNPYTSCLLTRGELCDQDADLVRRMTRASVRGWESYLKNPEPTNAKLHEVNKEMSLAILAFGAEEMRPLCFPAGEENQPFGRMAAERWETLARQLEETGLLKPGAVDPKQAFREEFVREASPAK